MSKKKAGKKAARPVRKAGRTSRIPKHVEEHFAEGLRRRGEAVPEPPPGAELPPGATHTFDPGAPKDKAKPTAGRLRRRRFSLL